MKNIFKVLAITALVAVIGFSFVACPKDNGNGNGNGSDGGDWTVVSNTPFGTNNISTVAYGNGTFVAGGQNGKMAYSTNNGKDWTSVSNSTFGTSSINGITYGDNKFVAVSDYDEIAHPYGGIAYSTDGITWTKVSAPVTEGYDHINDIAYIGGKFVAVGNKGMAYSDHGTSWTWVSNPPFGSWHSIGYGNDKFVAGGDASIAYSTDAISWAVTETERTNVKYFDKIYGVAYGGGMFVAVGGGSVGKGGLIMYSTDGISWTEVSNTTFIGTNHISAVDNDIYGVVWGGDRFVAVGAYGKAAYSTDGKNWTAVSKTGFGSSEHFGGIAYGDGTFVAVGVSSNGGKIAYSTGGSGTPPNTGGGTAGKLTITGLPSGGTYAVYVFPSGYDVSTVIGVTQGIAGDQIGASQSSSGNVFTMYNYPALTSFTASGSLPVVLQNSATNDPYGTANPMFRRATVNFSNGGATVPFNSFTAVTTMF
jgi:hypothetical protein